MTDATDAAKPQAEDPKPVGVPRWVVRTIWVAHCTAYAITAGRFGLRPATSTQWGMLRLTTVGRKSGKTRVAIVGFIVDGPNLVVPAMNGWADPEPAWWLNLQANPKTSSQKLPHRMLLIRITIPGRSIGRLPLSRFRASTVV